MTAKMRKKSHRPLPAIKAEAIRNRYSEMGVAAYYDQHGCNYQNPHFDAIHTLLLQNRHRIDYTQALDFCCGSGEVSQVLASMGYPLPTATDPYTGEAYQRRIGRTCLDLSFYDVICGKLQGQFSSVICSFAMHLCPPGQLFPLVFQLFECTKQIVVLTPHKRPELEKLEGVRLEFTDYTLTTRGKKVWLKAFRQAIAN